MSNIRASWNLQPPSGFQGLRSDLPLKAYHQALPHWRQDGATYFVTFRLHDSLPQEKLQELRDLKAKWEQRHAKERGLKSTLQSTRQIGSDDRDELTHEIMKRVETWLDQGMGSCCLKGAETARKVTDTMHATDG